MTSQDIDCFEMAIETKLGALDTVLLLLIWLLILIASLKFIGILGSISFLLLSAYLTVKRPSNGLLIILLLIYSPGIALQIPSILVVSSLITFFALVIKGNCIRSLRRIGNPILISAFIFAGWALGTTLLTNSLGVALRYWIQYFYGLILIILLLICLESPKDYGRILKWWAIIAALSLLISVAHYIAGTNTFLYSILKNVRRPDGFTAVTPTVIGIGLDKVVRRLIWPGIGPNYYSANLIFPLSIALAFYDASTSRQKPFWMLVCGMIFAAVVGTFSRSGFLVVCVVGFAFILRRNIRAIFPTLVLLAAFLVTITAIPELIIRIRSILDAIASGATGRFAAWQLAVKMWLSSPLWGNGLGSFFAKYRSVPHNTYLTILSETGIVGLLIYLSIIIQALYNCLHIQNSNYIAHRKKKKFLEILVIGLVGMCFMIGTISYEEVKLLWAACFLCLYGSMLNVTYQHLKEKTTTD